MPQRMPQHNERKRSIEVMKAEPGAGSLAISMYRAFGALSVWKENQYGVGFYHSLPISVYRCTGILKLLRGGSMLETTQFNYSFKLAVD